MIPTEKHRPKVRHSSVSLSDKNRLNGVIGHFCKSVLLPLAMRKQRDGLKGWDDPENLLDLRKALVRAVSKGMLERKDQEEEIVLLAIFVWWTRLSEQRRREIVGEWG